MHILIFVGVGGFVGAVLRFALAEAITADAGGFGFPLETLLVNMAGSFILALLFAAVPDHFRWSGLIRHGMGTGMIGSFTTFSALAAETQALLAQTRWLTALAYVACCLIGGAAMAGLGWYSGRRLAVSGRRKGEYPS